MTAIFFRTAGTAEYGLGRTPVVGIMSTTTTGTASGGLHYHSSAVIANQSSAHVTSTVNAATKGDQQQHQAMSSGQIKRSAGPRNLSVSFEASHEPTMEWRAKFGLLSKRKMSLPHTVPGVNVRVSRSADPGCSTSVPLRRKPLKV